MDGRKALIGIGVVACLCGLTAAPLHAQTWRTSMVYDYGTTINTGISPDHLAEVNGIVYFSAYSNSHGNELWRSNGTSSGTYRLTDIAAGTDNAMVNDIVGLGDGRFVFAATGTGSSNRELYISDGTAGGTGLLKDIASGSASSGPATMTRIGQEIYFRATDGTHGMELWKTDGSEAGTVMIKDVHTGATGSDPIHFFSFGGYTYFLAGSHDREMWRTNGTGAGTALFKDINPYGSSGASYFQELNGRMIFAASDNTHGLELFTSDGTPDGTVLLKDIRSGPSASNPSYFRTFGNYVYFSADDGVSGREIWRTDGTESGTSLFLDLQSGPASSTHNNFTVAGDVMFFNASDGVHGSELWATDGTLGGTFMAADIRSGPLSGFGAAGGNLVAVNGVAYFTGNDGTHGSELWKAVPVAPTSSFSLSSGYSYRTTLINDDGLETEVNLLDGVAAGARNLSLTLAERSGGDLSRLASDKLDLSGTGGDTFVLQIAYDEAVAVSLFGYEDDVRLGWWNGSQWMNAVAGNSGGTPLFIAGPYDGDLTLGHYGIDTANNLVWSVINHNSTFGAGQVVPEPSGLLLLLAGAGAVLARRPLRRIRKGKGLNHFDRV